MEIGSEGLTVIVAMLIGMPLRILGNGWVFHALCIFRRL
jgi:hypothetical protein